MNNLQKIMTGKKARTLLILVQFTVLGLVAFNAYLGIKSNRSVLKLNNRNENEE